MRHYFVRAALQQFAELAGYRGAFGLTLLRSRFEAERDRRKDATLVNEQNDYGITLVGEAPFVWINPKTNTSMDRLLRTLAHEAVHVALPDFPHGKAFEHKVSQIRRGDAL